MNGLGRGANYDSQVYLVVIATPLNATRSEDSAQGDTVSCSKIGFVNFSLRVPDCLDRAFRKQGISSTNRLVTLYLGAQCSGARTWYNKKCRQRAEPLPQIHPAAKEKSAFRGAKSPNAFSIRERNLRSRRTRGTRLCGGAAHAGPSPDLWMPGRNLVLRRL